MKRLPLSIIFAAFLISGSLCLGERDQLVGLIMYAAAAAVLFLYSCCRK
ncbi:MAG: hypothetical protein IJE66_02640 [Akkermansia sp.]|nr:hypothetical protein [Akkermansia sp.]